MLSISTGVHLHILIFCRGKQGVFLICKGFDTINSPTRITLPLLLVSNEASVIWYLKPVEMDVHLDICTWLANAVGYWVGLEVAMLSRDFSSQCTLHETPGILHLRMLISGVAEVVRQHLWSHSFSQPYHRVSIFSGKDVMISLLDKENDVWFLICNPIIPLLNTAVKYSEWHWVIHMLNCLVNK